jgi:hypothetical protein
MVDTVRALFLGGDLNASLWKILAWAGGLIVLFLVLATRRYKRLIMEHICIVIVFDISC